MNGADRCYIWFIDGLATPAYDQVCLPAIIVQYWTAAQEGLTAVQEGLMQ